jgi:hypothetical protein
MVAKELTYGKIEESLKGFIGTEKYYKRSILGRRTGMIYTDGVKHFVDYAEAQWFIDIVNSHMPVVLNRGKGDYFFTVVLTVHALEGGVNAVFKIDSELLGNLVTQEIPYTDLPIGEYKFFLALGQDGPLPAYVLMIPSEY